MQQHLWSTPIGQLCPRRGRRCQRRRVKHQQMDTDMSFDESGTKVVRVQAVGVGILGDITSEMREFGRTKKLTAINGIGVYAIVDETTRAKEHALWTAWADRWKGHECRSRLRVQVLSNMSCDDCFAPTAADDATRIALAFAALGGYPFRIADVCVAFLHADAVGRVVF